MKLNFKTLTALLLGTTLFTTQMQPLIAYANEPAYETESTKVIVTEEDWKNTEVGEYPFTPDSPEWQTMSYTDSSAACNMPESFAKSLSTEDLTEYALNYPFLLDVLAYESYTNWLNHLENSGVFKELFARPDCIPTLLNAYINTNYGDSVTGNSDDMNTYTKLMFLELYFGINYSELAAEEVETFVTELGRKYDAKPDYYKEFTGTTAFFSALHETMYSIPKKAIPDNMRDLEIFDYIPISSEINSGTTYVSSDFKRMTVSATPWDINYSKAFNASLSSEYVYTPESKTFKPLTWELDIKIKSLNRTSH